MSLSQLGLGAFVVGLLALAGLLYFLQRLRVKHRRQRVVTTMFWAEALEDSRARVLVERFRHPWTYALLLAITALIWLAVAGPVADTERNDDYVALLDAGIANIDSGDFEASKRALGSFVADVRNEAREVYVVGDEARLALAAGESKRLLPERLAGVSPQRSAVNLEGLLGRLNTRDKKQHVRLFGFWDADTKALSNRFPGLELSHGLRREPQSSPPRLLELGAAPSLAGSAGQVDLMVAYESGLRVELSIEGTDLGTVTVEETSQAGHQRRVYRNLASRGQRARVQLYSGDLVVDEASFILAKQQGLGCAVADGVPESLFLLIRHDPNLSIDPNGEVQVRRDEGVGDKPLFTTSPTLLAGSSVRISGAGAAEFARYVRDLLNEYGDQEQSRVEVLSSERRFVAVAEDLIKAEKGLAETAGLPILMGESLRWLADREESARYLRAGETFALKEPRRIARGEEKGRLLFDGSFRPDHAGPYITDKGEEVFAFLPRPSGQAVGQDKDNGVTLAGTSTDFIALIGLLAFALLAFEWFLLRGDKIP